MPHITTLQWRSLFHLLADMDKRAILALALLLQAIVTFSDYLTGPFVQFTLFYLAPIWLAGSFLSVRLAYVLAFLSTLTLGLTLYQGYEQIHLRGLAWGTFSNFVIFVLAAYASGKARAIIAEIDAQATVDTLTKVNTRRAFFELGDVELSRALRKHLPIRLAFIDLDNFKDVNDVLGHGAGDRLLAAVASAIRNNLRDGDILGRLGGDEFAVLFYELDKENIEQVVTRLMTNVKEAIAPLKTGVTFSVGVVSYTVEKPVTMDEVVAMADKAMYEVKRASKNAINFVTVS